MKKISKLMIFELLEGLFGWVYIGASIATLYFVISVIFFDGTWISFFWAFGVGAIARWLASGFKENKIRINLEGE